MCMTYTHPSLGITFILLCDINKRNSHHNYASYENNIVAWLLCDVHTIYHSSTFFVVKIFSLLLDLMKINKTK